MDSVEAVIDFLFGCHHHNYSLTTMSIEKRVGRDSRLTCLRIA
jgi:hypothetical protein